VGSIHKIKGKKKGNDTVLQLLTKPSSSRTLTTKQTFKITITNKRNRREKAKWKFVAKDEFKFF
jgi:hypothetical protein